jgi:hypothetical protein
MPYMTSPRTAPRPCCQLIDLLKETGRSEDGSFSLLMKGEVSERIHDRISFDKECWLIDEQEIQDNRVIGRTVQLLYSKEPDPPRSRPLVFESLPPPHTTHLVFIGHIPAKLIGAECLIIYPGGQKTYPALRYLKRSSFKWR